MFLHYSCNCTGKMESNEKCLIVNMTLKGDVMESGRNIMMQTLGTVKHFVELKCKK